MKQNLKIAIGMLAGAALGFVWYKVVGCASGACPLTSNPWTSTFVGLMFGAMLASSSGRTGQSTKSAEIKE